MFMVNRFVNFNHNKKHLSAFLENLKVSNFLNILNRILKKIDEKQFLNDEEEDPEGLGLSHQDFTFKFMEFLFESLFLGRLMKNDEWFSDIPLENRIDLLRILNYRFNNIDRLISVEKNELDNAKLVYIEHPTVSSLMNLLEFNIANFNNLIDENRINDENFDSVNNCLLEIKLSSRCLNDLLTIEETEITREFILSNLMASQENQILFKKICGLFRVINENLNLKSLHDKMKTEPCSKQRLGFTNLKCEIVRSIGILVYGNYPNQRLLVEYQILHLLAKNLNLDLENPFVREWSIVALKHVLTALDHETKG